MRLCARIFRALNLHVMAHFRHHTSDEVPQLIVANRGESTERTRHCMVRRKIRTTYTCGRYVVQLPIIPKGQRIPEILFLQPKAVLFERQGGQPRRRSFFCQNFDLPPSLPIPGLQEALLMIHNT